MKNQEEKYFKNSNILEKNVVERWQNDQTNKIIKQPASSSKNPEGGWFTFLGYYEKVNGKLKKIDTH